MASWLSYFKIVTPAQQKQRYTTLATDGVSPSHANGSGVASITWYSQVMKGAGSRMQRYVQYDSMDNDIDVSRALDIIAEECSNDDEKTNLPFMIEYQTEDDEEVSETIVSTLRAALRHWSNFQDLNNRIFRVARIMVKYGDCFFKKSSDTKKWNYLDPSKVMGLELDQDGEKVAYHLKDEKGGDVGYNKQTNVTAVPAAGVIHFTLSDEMGESAPFGESILQPVFRTFKQLSMLEDSTIIYQIVRAPERRVFYIDVGNMPPQRVKQYLETIRNELRQKRIPNSSGSSDVIDGAYNPACLSMDTKVALLDGRNLTIAELAEEHQAGKQNWTYSCDPTTGKLAPGLITWAGKTREAAQVVKLTLDNKQSIICTPDHKFPIQGIGLVEAKDITTSMSLVPFNRRINEAGYEEVFDVSRNKWSKTHRMVAEQVQLETLRHKSQNSPLTTVHHANFNKLDNSPSNLVWMNNRDHYRYHADFNRERFAAWNPEKQKAFVDMLQYNLKNMSLEEKVEAQKNRQVALSMSNQKIGRPKTIRRQSNYGPAKAQRLIVSPEIKAITVDILKQQPFILKPAFIDHVQSDERFLSAFMAVNKPTSTGRRSKPTWTYVSCLVEAFNCDSFTELKLVAQNANHKVISIEYLSDKQDVGCITVDYEENIHGYHTFALADVGVFTRNSLQEDYYMPITTSGRGTRVEVLPGGENLGENANLMYFQKKMFRGLRVPTSYMTSQDANNQSAVYNDGKLGVAYIEELRFANFIRRIQNKIEKVYDDEFKLYLDMMGISIDHDLFKLRLPEPQNFALYRQAALNNELINSFKAIEDVSYLSKRWMLKKIMGMTEDELQMNEIMVKQERNIRTDQAVSDLQQIYDPAVFQNRDAVKVEAPEGEEAPAAGGMGGGEAPMGGLGGGEAPGGAPGGEEGLSGLENM